MAVGRISGPLLKSNLIRNGINLAFETDLLYLDVNNQRIGVKTSAPQHELDVNGTIRTVDLQVLNQADIAEITINGSTISTSNSYLNLGTLDTVVYQNKATIDNIDIEGNVISTNSSNANLELRPNGTGSVEILSDMNVNGNIHATGNITADGNITIGDANTDNIIFNAEIASDIIPDATNTYALGSNPTIGGKQWSDVWVDNFVAGSVSASAIVVDGVDLVLRQGNIYYVAENGSDLNTGDHPQDPFASIKQALSVATAGDTVHVYPGDYTEIFPLEIPVGVTLVGESLRSVTIRPTSETRYKDAILMNGETTVQDVTLTGFYSGGDFFAATDTPSANQITFNVGTAPFAHTYVSGGTFDVGESTQANVTAATYNHTTGELVITLDAVHGSHIGNKHFISGLVFSCNGGNRTFPDNGYAFRFATNFEVTTRSPYVKNITVITAGTTITAEDPRGFNSGDAGKGAYIDGAYATANSREASMLFHAATFITPGVDAVSCTNGVRVEWLNSFTYFADKSIYAFNSNDGKASNGKTFVRLSGIGGTPFAAGDTVTFTSTDASTVVTATVESVNDDVLVIDGKYDDLDGFDFTPQSIVGVPSGATATTIENVDKRDFGAEIRMIGSASVYGNFGLYGDGDGVIIYAIGQNLAYIGNGKEVTNDPSTVIQANEVVELNGAKVRYNSVDHKGDFRVGEFFYVNQEDGTVSFTASALQINLTNGVTFTSGANTTFINGERIDTGNLRFTGNTVSSTSGDINFDADSDIINLLNDVDITGNLDVTGNVSIGGNITIGDENTDSLNIIAGINSDLIPETTSTYSLGSMTNTWSNLYVDEVNIDNIEINTNYITTTNSNADLELRANGTGQILVPDNDVQINNNITVDGLSNLSNVTIIGTVTHTGNVTQTGDTTITGNVTVTQDLDVSGAAQFEEILVDDNIITTTTSNADLELQANGTGKIFVPNNDLEIANDLTILGTITAQNINVSGTITANKLSTGDILVDDNFITTTLSNSDLELRTSGSGAIVIDDINVFDYTISTANDLIIAPGSQILIIDATGSLQLPAGNTAQRPAGVAGQIRFNNQLNRFEGFDGSDWIQLHGVQDLDGDTKVTAELSQGANDNIIRFDVEGSTIVDVNSVRLNAPKITIDDIEIDGNLIQTISTDTDLVLDAQGTGKIVIDNFELKNNTITNTVSNSVTTFVNTNNGYVKFNGAYGMVIPVGGNSDRPPLAFTEIGQMRWNTDAGRTEIWDGSNWVSVAGTASGISRAEAEELALSIVLTLG